MEKLNKDELFLLAIEMDLPTLLNFCSLNKKTRLICKQESIWKYRLNEDFSNDLPYFIKSVWLNSSKDLYIFLYSLKKLNNILGNELNDIYEFYNKKLLFIEPKTLAEIPENISLLVNLRSIAAPDNYIETIPKEFFLLTNLIRIDFSYNKISEIPKEIGNLTKLETLNLSHNKIKEIPKEIGLLINLQSLELDSNFINKLPKEITNLNNLRQLFLFNNQISEIPEKFKSFALI